MNKQVGERLITQRKVSASEFQQNGLKSAVQGGRRRLLKPSKFHSWSDFPMLLIAVVFIWLFGFLQYKNSSKVVR